MRPVNRTRRAPRQTATRQAGTTIIEIGMVLAIIGLMGAVALPPLVRRLDGIAVRSATAAIASACAVARSAAVMRGALATVAIDVEARRVTVSVAHRLDEPPYRLTLAATRAIIEYDAVGLGSGASNTTVVARQGTAADTLFTSRLGRVRR